MATARFYVLWWGDEAVALSFGYTWLGKGGEAEHTAYREPTTARLLNNLSPNSQQIIESL